MPNVAVIWRSPFAAIEQLQLLPGGSNSDTYYASSDGQTIVGWSDDGAGALHAVKWDKTTLAVTQFPSLGGAPNFAFACSPDASIIFAHNDQPAQQVARYTGSGSTGALLSPTGGLPNVGLPPWSVRFCSDDGAVAVGQVGGASGTTGVAARYDGTTATILPRVAGIPDANAYTARCISQDAAVIVGDDNFDISMFWLGATVHRLKNPSALVVPGHGAYTQAYACNGNGSVIWGSAVDDSFPAQRACYWNSLATLNGDGTYGAAHFLAALISGAANLPSGVNWCAEATGTPIAVGAAGSAAGGSGVKWVGTAATELPPLAGAIGGAQANGCSGDGALVVGRSNDATFTNWPVYWNTAVDTTPHKLPVLPFETSGLAKGASRDGSLIYGQVTVSGGGGDGGGTTPPPAPKIAMDNVVCVATTTLLSENLVSLRWSDDRGHSWGSPVSQSIGEAGEYRTSLQWQRLSFARDRIFEISWSVPMRTALQGCWVDVTPAQS